MTNITAKQMGQKSQEIQKKKFGIKYASEMQRRSKVRDDILARLDDRCRTSKRTRQEEIEWLVENYGSR